MERKVREERKEEGKESGGEKTTNLLYPACS